MKTFSMVGAIILLISGSLAQGAECRGRNCVDVEETYESIEYARERVELVVNHYFNEAMAAAGLGPSEAADRHNTASAWAAENTGHPPAHIMDAWEAEYFFKLRVLMVEDPRFSSGLPPDVQVVLRTYHTRKLESLSDSAGG